MEQHSTAASTPVIEDPSLFSEETLDTLCGSKRDAVHVAIERYDQKQLMSRSTSEMVQTIVASHRVEVPRIDEQGVYYTQSRCHRGAVLKFHVPYTGDSSLFRLRPSKLSAEPPRGIVEPGHLVITVLAVGYDGKSVRAAVDDNLAKLNHCLMRLRLDVDDLNATLGAHAENEIEARRNQWLMLEQMERDIGYPKRSETR
jgi:hypothetical protein